MNGKERATSIPTMGGLASTRNVALSLGMRGQQLPDQCSLGMTCDLFEETPCHLAKVVLGATKAGSCIQCCLVSLFGQCISGHVSMISFWA